MISKNGTECLVKSVLGQPRVSLVGASPIKGLELTFGPDEVSGRWGVAVDVGSGTGGLAGGETGAVVVVEVGMTETVGDCERLSAAGDAAGVPAQAIATTEMTGINIGIIFRSDISSPCRFNLSAFDSLMQFDSERSFRERFLRVHGQ
jgi:hypothetical protein